MHDDVRKSPRILFASIANVECVCKPLCKWYGQKRDEMEKEMFVINVGICEKWSFQNPTDHLQAVLDSFSFSSLFISLFFSISLYPSLSPSLASHLFLSVATDNVVVVAVMYMKHLCIQVYIVKHHCDETLDTFLRCFWGVKTTHLT